MSIRIDNKKKNCFSVRFFNYTGKKMNTVLNTVFINYWKLIDNY
nr:MAG TPA: hypothetical protein [Caudoviricetes sp.]DAP00140.1 MAG TPA: hypothetical protein [Caudoviricetes sp.]